MSEIEITGVFENVLGMIYSAKQKAEYQVNSTIIDLYWSIGEYVSKQIDVNGWGKSTVKALSEYILSKEPGIRGYSSQNIWRMKQFYDRGWQQAHRYVCDADLSGGQRYSAGLRQRRGCRGRSDCRLRRNGLRGAVGVGASAPCLTQF